jgi:hypothetical protein
MFVALYNIGRKSKHVPCAQSGTDQELLTGELGKCRLATALAAVRNWGFVLMIQVLLRVVRFVSAV